MAAAIDVDTLSHRYGERTALDRISLSIGEGEIFAFLGPNGGGKSTLFRVLSTLAPIQSGGARVFGLDLRRETAAIRRQIGVAFQAASLDRKLTVAENLRHQGRLYGISGSTLRSRIGEALGRLGVADRAGDLVETLSGGLKRRVELAKALLHGPRLLLLDEPSTALDPAARGEVWRYLEEVRRANGVTVALTTHLLDEADKADRIAILDRGRLAALDTPDNLKAAVGGDSITIETSDAPRLSADISARFGVAAQVLDGNVRLEQANGHEWIARIVEAFPGRVAAIRVGKPTLEDVFIDRCGRRFGDDEPVVAESKSRDN
ncbi:MAG: ABC transporter ATP-binding protein [Planctomycetota bacterium]|nr:MAG: ABC transporter ATP-binding protein [Planctomycetota bacterium]